MSFGENVRWLRKERGLSQATLASLIRVRRHIPTASYVSRVESGKLDPRLSTVRSLARALRVKAWVLLADVSENVDFWREYLDLSPAQKRQLQRHIEWMLRKK